MAQLRRVAIVGGNRIPFARSNTVYATASNQDMLTSALEGLVERFNLHGVRVGEFAAGAVLKHSRDFNLARECVLGSRLAPETPAYDIQQACGTGLEAAILVANKIALGQIECGIAGGVDTTSDAPIGVHEELRKILLEANRGKTTGDKDATLIERASIVDVGTLGAFEDSAVILNPPRTDHASIVIGNRLYVIGGRTVNSEVLKTIFSADIHDDGTLGAFSLYPSELVDARCGHSLVLVGRALYVLGGQDAGNVPYQSIERATIGSYLAQRREGSASEGGTGS